MNKILRGKLIIDIQINSFKILYKIMILSLALIMLTGCEASVKSEKEIKSELPEELTQIYIQYDGDSIISPLDIKSLEITKRKTEERNDTVYCTIVANDDVYEYHAKCTLYYSYYDKGGWLLDDYTIENSDIIAINHPAQEIADSEMEKYNFDSFEYQNVFFEEDSQSAVFEYNVSYYRENVSYDGIVQLIYNFDPILFGWSSSLFPQDQFEWNIEDSWAYDGSEKSSSRWSVPYFEIDIIEINEEEGVTFTAEEYNYYSAYKIEEYSTGGEITSSHYYEYGDSNSEDDEEYEKSYDPPTLCFEFLMNGVYDYKIKITPETAYVYGSGGGRFIGELIKGGVIEFED